MKKVKRKVTPPSTKVVLAHGILKDDRDYEKVVY
jgi:hypothetical protein